MDSLLTEMLKWGPPGILAAVFFYLWRDEKKAKDAAVAEGKEQFKAVFAALQNATTATTTAAEEDRVLKAKINELLTLWKVRHEQA